MSMNGLELPAQTGVYFFILTPYLARAHVCRRFVFNPCPHEATMFKDKRGRTIH